MFFAVLAFTLYHFSSRCCILPCQSCTADILSLLPHVILRVSVYMCGHLIVAAPVGVVVVVVKEK
jgi:hypothetical protein